MIDETLRQTKDEIFIPFARAIGDKVHPIQITLLGGGVGLLSALAGLQGNYTLGLVLWLGNRFLDGLDGAVARACGKQSDLGGYLDTLTDFVMYTLVPFALVMHNPAMDSLIMLGFLLGTFYINSAAFLYLSAILERRNQTTGLQHTKKLTTIVMPRGIIEGTEAILFYSLFFVFPGQLTVLFGLLGLLVIATSIQHIIWASRNLKD